MTIIFNVFSNIGMIAVYQAIN